MISERELTRRLRALNCPVVSQVQVIKALEIPASTFYAAMAEKDFTPFGGLKLGTARVLPLESAIDWAVNFQHEFERKAKVAAR